MSDDALHYASNRVLTASQIGSYLYCNRSWWLDSVGGYQPANVEELEQGELLHEEHGLDVRRSSRQSRAGVVLLGAGAFLVLVWILLQVLA